MNHRIDFINSLGLSLSAAQLACLELYADLVWQKKEQLNLTSVRDKQEIWDRHILDGLISAAYIAKTCGGKSVSAADYGAGAGYIGIVLKIALDFCSVTLVEGLQKRCLFMEWVNFKLGLKNIKVLNARAETLEQQEEFDFTLERAMGKIDEVLPLCTARLKRGGLFLAYQGEDCAFDKVKAEEIKISQQSIISYTLPCDDKIRKLAVFKKDGHN